MKWRENELLSRKLTLFTEIQSTINVHIIRRRILIKFTNEVFNEQQITLTIKWDIMKINELFMQ